MKPTDSTPNPQSVCKHCQKNDSDGDHFRVGVMYSYGDGFHKFEPSEPASLNAPAGTEGQEPKCTCNPLRPGIWHYVDCPAAPAPAEHQGVQPVAGEGPLPESPVKFKHNGFEHTVDRMAQGVIDSHPGSTLTAAYRAVALELFPAEVTPKLKELSKRIYRAIEAETAKLATPYRTYTPPEQYVAERMLEVIAAILRPFITPASTPPEIEQEYRDICNKLADCARRHGLGLGGEGYDALVIAELDRLSRPSSTASTVPAEKRDPLNCTNPVYLELRQIYCCKGAEFSRPTLAKAWKEIARLDILSTGEANGHDLLKLVNNLESDAIAAANMEEEDDGHPSDYYDGYARGAEFVADQIRKHLNCPTAPTPTESVRGQVCGVPLGSTGYVAIYCALENGHAGEHRAFCSASPSVPLLDVDKGKKETP